MNPRFIVFEMTYYLRPWFAGSRLYSRCQRLTRRSKFHKLNTDTINLACRPVLLVKKAQQKRKETGDDRYYAAMERESFTFTQRIENVLARPFKMLLFEPMLLVITIYMSVSPRFD